MVVYGFVLAEYTRITQLLCEDIFGNGGLGDVCPVQIIHAVRPYRSTLQLDVTRIGAQGEVPAKKLMTTNPSQHCRLPLDFDVILDLVDQDTDPIPSHVLALCVKIEVLIVYFLNLELGQKLRFHGLWNVSACHLYLVEVFLVGLLHRLFVPFVVDKVH